MNHLTENDFIHRYFNEKLEEFEQSSDFSYFSKSYMFRILIAKEDLIEFHKIEKGLVAIKIKCELSPQGFERTIYVANRSLANWEEPIYVSYTEPSVIRQKELAENLPPETKANINVCFNMLENYLKQANIIDDIQANWDRFNANYSLIRKNK